MTSPAAAAAPVRIRDAETADVARLTEIYAHYVETSIATFEEVVPGPDEMAARWRSVTASGLPWLVADDGERVCGYAYAGPFRPRSAYRYTVEDSIYVAPECARRGYGSALLAALIERAEALGKRQMVAVIGGSTTVGSIGLHARHGFRVEGVLPSTGFKFGNWADTVIMTRRLGAGDSTRPGG